MHRSSATTTTTTTTTVRGNAAVGPTAAWEKDKATSSTTTTTILKNEKVLTANNPKNENANNKESSSSSSTTTTTTTTTTIDNTASTGNKRSGGFYDQQTFWQQELYRYHPSFWLIVRIGSLLGYPCLASWLGPYVYPMIVSIAQSNDLEVEKVALPLIATMGMMVFFTHNALYGLIYHYDHKFQLFEKYRVDDKPWHWDLMTPQQWQQMIRTTMVSILFNFFGLTFPLLFLNLQYGIGTPVRTDYIDDTSIPNWLEILIQILFCTFLEDFGFHHAHAALHTKQLYWIHKIHHQYHAPIAISAAYAHPIEYLLGNILPSLLGPMILRKRMHLWTFGAWMIFRGSAAIENHSGYEFPWSMYQAIPFKAPTEYHDFHHNRNQGTYSGVLRFWDWVYGTNRDYFEWVQAGRPDTIKTQRYKEKQQLLQQKKEE